MRRPTAIFGAALLSGVLAACGTQEAHDKNTPEVNTQVNTEAVPAKDPVPQPAAADKKAVAPDDGVPAVVPARRAETVTVRDKAKPAKPAAKTETGPKTPAARETAAPAERTPDPHAGHDMKGTQP